MKIFIIGSKSGLNKGDSKTLDRFCQQLGEQLGASSHEVIVCSEWRTSADYQVLQGIALLQNPKTPKKVIVHRPDDDLIKKAWRGLERDLKLEPQYTSHIGPTFRDENGNVASEEGLRMAFLLCQMAALKECDIVVTVGGRTDGPAAVVLAVAREQRKPILAFRFLGGAAEKVYNQIEGELRQRLENEVEMLSYEEEGSKAILRIIERLQQQAKITRLVLLR